MKKATTVEPTARMREAAEKLEKATAEYVAAMEALRDGGASFGVIAEASGMTRSGVQKMLARRSGT